MRPARLELSAGSHGDAVRRRLDAWRRESVPNRLAARDADLWASAASEEAEDRLGWIDLPRTGEETLGDWLGFAAAERAAGIDRVVVLGMGGSSLAPEVFERVFGGERPVVVVLDSTHPDAVRRLDENLDLERTLFVVSSKSGSTVETLSLFRYFWERASRSGDRGRHFVAITDPGSPLEELAKRLRFHRIFAAPPDVGGRYSALSAFGLVPAAFTGVDLRSLVGRGRSALADLEGGWSRAASIVELGAFLGELARVGIDKLTLVTAPGLESFPDWLEQLVAESTGKQGRGILPVVGEALAEPSTYGPDRLFVGILLDGERGGSLERSLKRLAAAGFPVALTRLSDRLDLGYEMVRWEIAVALAGSVLAIDPFSQPDVERAKRLARDLMAGETEVLRAVESIERRSVGEVTTKDLDDWLEADEVEYVAICAYLPSDEETADRLARLRHVLGRRSGRPVTVGIGPRFLHSTGQLHKGGAKGARFLQLIQPAQRDLPIPQSEGSFGELVAAQADGDAAALVECGQTVLRIELGEAVDLDRLIRRVEGSA
ncbi:MAG: hypothetical protein R3244_03340 [Thermoanaerobaculia bacterium]|nr:hypothetical protein [Thermoanaerobaculia bacterium]